MSTAFTGQAIATAFDRRSGVLRLLGTTPLGRGGLLAGRIAAVLAVECIQWVVLGGLALALGWRPHLAGLPLAVLGLLLGTATFVSLALLVAGTLRAEAVLAVANLLWVVLLPLGLLLPADRLPGVAAAVAPWTPGGALGELLAVRARRDGRVAVALGRRPCRLGRRRCRGRGPLVPLERLTGPPGTGPASARPRTLGS